MCQKPSSCSCSHTKDHHHAVVHLSDGHKHGDNCGHERVQHDDHYDYIGDDGLLHHLLDDHCVVSHGHFSILHRRKKQASPPSPTPPTTTDGASSSSQKIVTKIFCAGICCPMEIPVVEAALGRMPGFESVEVSVVTKTVTVTHIPTLSSPAAMVAALNESRLGASLTFPREQSKGKRSWLPPWYIWVSIVLLLISLLHYFQKWVPWMEYFKWVALGPVALCLPGIALKALGALRHFVFDIHLLITIAAAGAIAIGDYSEASIVVVLFCIADFLEVRCTGQARDAISAVLALKPETAVLASTGEQVQASDIEPGTLILIRAGEKVPLDGIVVSGTSAFDESILTGESVAVVKHFGDSVSAGTLNAGSGLVHVKTTTTSEDTFVAGMARLVEQATSRQSPAEAAVARFAKIYTPLVLLACILLAFVPWSNPNNDKVWWVYLSLQVLVTACPCALVLSTPVTVVSALARAAQVGVLIKGGVVLETLSHVKVVSFDKTGTLTLGQFLVENITLHNGWTEPELMKLLGSLERGSSHPLAAAIVGRAAARGVECNAPVFNASTVPGFGIVGTVDTRVVRAGTFEFIKQDLVDDKEECVVDSQTFENTGLTTCYISVDSTYVGCITARDALRPDAKDAVSDLIQLGITPSMLTGDNAAVALAIGQAAGIDPANIHASLLPQDKLDLVSTKYKSSNELSMSSTSSVLSVPTWWCGRKRTKKIKVAHVGDGVNDAPALAAADVGIAMGVGGAAAALEAGSVALFTNDLRIVAALQRLARAAKRKILFNIFLSVVTKVAVLVLASLGKFTLFGAVLVDVGTALLVTLNGLTLLRWDFGLPNAVAVCVGAQANKIYYNNNNVKGTTACADAGCCSDGTVGGCCNNMNTSSKATRKKSSGGGGGCSSTAPHQHTNSSCCNSTSQCCGTAGQKTQTHDHDHHDNHHQRHHHHRHQNGTACCDDAAEAAAEVVVIKHSSSHDHQKSSCCTGESKRHGRDAEGHDLCRHNHLPPQKKQTPSSQP